MQSYLTRLIWNINNRNKLQLMQIIWNVMFYLQHFTFQWKLLKAFNRPLNEFCCFKLSSSRMSWHFKNPGIYINTFFVIFISLWLFCFDWPLTGLSISEFYKSKLIFGLRHNLEGKYDNIPYTQSGFYWCKIKFQMIRICTCHVQSG